MYIEEQYRKGDIQVQGEESIMDQSRQKVFIVLNPTAGNADQGEALRKALSEHFAEPDWTAEIYETTGKEDLAAICREATEKGASLVVAAGGDGTLVGVANGLVNCETPLGILPMGTGNDLARVLSVPLKVEEALDVLTGEHEVLEMDALKVGDRYYFSNVSVGFSPQMMKETKSEQKKRFGVLAYLWTMFKQSRIYQLRRYTLTIDGQKRHVRATEVLISNPTLLEAPPHLFGPPETLNDGQLEAYLVTAHRLGEYLRLAWFLLRHGGRSATTFQHWTGQKSIRIEADQRPQMVQADGEVIGHTPVEVQLVPKALRVIMPKPKPAEATA